MGSPAALVLRPALPADSRLAYEARRAAFREYVEQAGGWNEDRERQQHARRFAAHDFRIVRLGDRDVGVVALAVEDDCLHLLQLFVLPGRQGRGIGGRCLGLVLDEARALGLTVRVRVRRVNPRALALYERHGFGRAGETATHLLLEHPAGSAEPSDGPGSLPRVDLVGH